MNKTLVTIVAMSVDSRHAVLYTPNGATLTIPQGDARLPGIVAAAREPLNRGEAVEIDITPIVPMRTEFLEAEKGTKGVVKFFRVARSFLKGLVNTESPEKVDEGIAHISPLEIGVFPGQQPKAEPEEKDAAPQQPAEEPAEVDAAPAVADETPVQADQKGPGFFVDAPNDLETSVDTGIGIFPASQNTPVEDATTRQAEPVLTNDQKLDAAAERLQQIMGAGKSTADAEFHTPLNEETETIVAVHTGTGAVIPDAQKLSRQLRAAAKLQDYDGFTRFIERLSAIIDDRGHSVEDLMKFIEKGDLPIADDGCIVIYKRLRRKNDGHFVDVHSGNIRQKVGSFVFMRAGLVDPNRRQDCSNGLHVASLSYLNNFSGDVTIVAKVRPEDVFAVPEYNHNKMRVSAYHILVELPDQLATLVNSGGSLSSTAEGAVILNKVLRGNHIGIIQHVEVGGQNGSNVTYTNVEAAAVSVATGTDGMRNTTLDMSEEIKPEIPTAPEIKATELKLVQNVPVITSIMSTSTEKAEDNGSSEPVKEVKPTLAQKAGHLYDALLKAGTAQEEDRAAQALRDFKKSARKGWAALGLPSDMDAQLADFAEKDRPKAKNLGKTTQIAQKEPVPSATAKPAKSNKKSAKKVKPGQKSDNSAPPKQDEGQTKSDMVKLALEQLKEGLPNIQVADNTGLSKDQVYRLKKKLST